MFRWHINPYLPHFILKIWKKCRYFCCSGFNLNFTQSVDQHWMSLFPASKYNRIALRNCSNQVVVEKRTSHVFQDTKVSKWTLMVHDIFTNLIFFLLLSNLASVCSGFVPIFLVGLNLIAFVEFVLIEKIPQACLEPSPTKHLRWCCFAKIVNSLTAGSR